MRNDAEKNCGGNQNAHFTFSTFFFSKILPFVRQCGKNMAGVGGEGGGADYRWQI